MVITITGASGGIGFELLKKCSQNENNLVIAISRHTKTLEKWVQNADRFNVLVITADITKEAHLKKVVKTIENLKLNVDVLVNNAGLLVNKDFESILPEELEEVYRTNVFAPFRLIQLLLPFMKNKGRGHIVNIGSMGGVQGVEKFQGLSAYTSSKAALSGLSECLALELAPRNIAVNCLALGAVQTEMLSQAFPGYKAPMKAEQMAEFIYDFVRNGQKYFNGKIIPVSLSTP
jgi:3-oxoacyl-[acyl-carrier protein] reductase